VLGGADPAKLAGPVREGDHVLARAGGESRWLKAQVQGLNEDGTLDLRYSDTGKEEFGLFPELVKFDEAHASLLPAKKTWKRPCLVCGAKHNRAVDTVCVVCRYPRNHQSSTAERFKARVEKLENIHKKPPRREPMSLGPGVLAPLSQEALLRRQDSLGGGSLGPGYLRRQGSGGAGSGSGGTAGDTPLGGTPVPSERKAVSAPKARGASPKDRGRKSPAALLLSGGGLGGGAAGLSGDRPGSGAALPAIGGPDSSGGLAAPGLVSSLVAGAAAGAASEEPLGLPPTTLRRGRLPSRPRHLPSLGETDMEGGLDASTHDDGRGATPEMPLE